MNNEKHNSKKIKEAITTTALKIFSTLVRILLRNGVTYKTASQWLRWIYVDIASNEFKLAGRKQSKSRVAILTGLSRMEVDRLMKSEHPHKTTAIDQYHRASRVLDGWIHDPAYQDLNGKPLMLKFDGSSPSFTSLVEKYSGGVPPRSIKDELFRVKSIELSPEGLIQLRSAYFVTINDKDTLYQFGMLGFATKALMETIDYNMYQCKDSNNTHLQLVASNDNIPIEILDDIKQKLQDYGRKCVVDADKYMFEKTEKSTASKQVKRAGIGVYYFEDSNSQDHY